MYYMYILNTSIYVYDIKDILNNDKMYIQSYINVTLLNINTSKYLVNKERVA